MRSLRAVRGGRLAPVVAACLMALGCRGEPEPVLTEEALKSATYLFDSAGSGTVTLQNGFHRVTAVESNRPIEILLEMSALGDLDGDGDDDAAAVLLEDMGNLGSRFYQLHALLSESGEPSDVARRLLGDGIRIAGLAIDSGVISVHIGDPVEGDSSAGGPQVLRLVLTTRGLEQLPLEGSETAPLATRASAAPLAADLLDTEWSLTAIEIDQRVVTPAYSDLGDPVIRFSPELASDQSVSGRVIGTGLCNRIFGSFIVAVDRELSISSLATTRMICAEQVMEVESLLLGGLETALSYEVSGDELTIVFAGGMLRFVLTPADQEGGA
jgi:heat shock protein HslJ